MNESNVPNQIKTLLKKGRFIYSVLFHTYDPNKITEAVKLFETKNREGQLVFGISIDDEVCSIIPAYDEVGDRGFLVSKQVGLEEDGLETIEVGIYSQDIKALKAAFHEIALDLIEGLTERIGNG